MRFLVIATTGVFLSVEAFTPPVRQAWSPRAQLGYVPTTAATTSTTLYALEPSSVLLASMGEAATSTDALASSPLMNYFLETLITNGVPALFSIIVIGFAAVMFGKSRKSQQDDLLETRNPVAQLYNDLYGDQDQTFGKRMNARGPFFGPNDGKIKLPSNAGVPSREYIKITHLNRQLDSYKYSLQAATQSKFKAAADFRQVSFARAFGKALFDGPARQEMLKAEADYLKVGSALTAKITDIQTKLTQMTVDKELESFGMKSVYDLDATYNETTDETVAVVKKQKSSRGEYLATLGKLQRELQEAELDFIQRVVQAAGPGYGASVRTALLGDVAVRGSGGLLRALEDRPLRTILKGVGEEGSDPKPGNLFVTRFPGDGK